MSKQIINIGSAPNDGTGDTYRVAHGKAKSNFDELYPTEIITNILKFDKVGGNKHENKTYILLNGPLVIDPTDATDLCYVKFLWSGAENPTITGVSAALIKTTTPAITEQGNYTCVMYYESGWYFLSMVKYIDYVPGTAGDTAAPATPIITNIADTTDLVSPATPIITNIT